MAVIAVAGAGGQALAWLLGIPGASRTVLEAVVPYGRRAMADLLGSEPEQYVAPETAARMAAAAYTRALRLREGNEPVVGLGCTASIATDRQKRGEHRCCVATRSASSSTSYDLILTKGARDRADEENVVSRVLLCSLAEACGIDSRLPLGLLDTEGLEVSAQPADDPLQALLSGEGVVHSVVVGTEGEMAADEPLGGVAVLPGAFQPLHWGHRQLAEAASEVLGTEVVFEISVTNVDKAPLDETEVRSRLPQFLGKWRVVLTHAPTFREKSALLPGCTFVIGWDTAVRLVHPRYYGDSEQAMESALADIWDRGCRFLVARRMDRGAFRTIADVHVPPRFAGMFQVLPESRFRADVSSTELRSRESDE